MSFETTVSQDLIQPEEDDRDLVEFEMFSNLKKADPVDYEVIRNEIYEHYKFLVTRIVKKYQSSYSQFIEDLEQEGTIGLLNAIDKFDLEKGVQFVTYATKIIDGAIRHCIRDRYYRGSIRIPTHAHKTLNDARTEAIKHGMDITNTNLNDPRIQNYLGISQDQARIVSDAISGQENAVSLDMPNHNSQDEADYDTLGDQLPSEDCEFARTELRVIIDQIISTLSPIEATVIRMLFFDNASSEEITRVTGKEYRAIQYTKTRAMQKLKVLLSGQI